MHHEIERGGDGEVERMALGKCRADLCAKSPCISALRHVAMGGHCLHAGKRLHLHIHSVCFGDTIC